MHTFLPGFLQSMTMTALCEFGDRTFFIAALLSTRSSSPLSVWCAILLAVSLTSTLTALLAQLLPHWLSDMSIRLLATLTFIYFAQHLCRESLQQKQTSSSPELAEVRMLLQQQHKTSSSSSSSSSSHTTSNFSHAFGLALAAECGDRSQIATVAMSASRNVSAVVLGAVVGHALCTAVAVVGGHLLAARISDRHVTLVTAFVYALFACLSLSRSLF